MSSADVIAEKQQTAAAAVRGGSTSSSQGFHSTRSSKMLCNSSADKAPPGHRHSRHSNSNAGSSSSSRHSHNGSYTHSSSRTRSTNSHRKAAVQCLPSDISAKDDQLGTGGGETAKQHEKRRVEKEKSHESQRGRRDEEVKKTRRTDESSSTNSGGRDKGCRADDAAKERRVEQRTVATTFSVEKASALDGGIKSRKDGRSDREKTTKERKDCKTDEPLMNREGSSSSTSSGLEDTGAAHVAAVHTDAVATPGGLHRMEKADAIAPEERQQQTNHSKSHKDRRDRHERQGKSEKKSKELSALPHHKSRRHRSAEAGDRVALQASGTAEVTKVETENRQAADIQASARKATNADSAAGSLGNKDEKHQREKRRETDASDHRAEKKKRRYAEAHEEKKEVAEEGKETRHGAKQTNKQPSTSGEMQQRGDRRQLQQRERSQSPSYHDSIPSNSKSSGEPRTRERDSSSSAGWRSGTMVESNSNRVTHSSSSSSRREREKVREGEGRGKSKRRHRRNDVADAAATATQSSSCSGSRGKHEKSCVAEETSSVTKEKPECHTNIALASVEEGQQRGSNNDSIARISSSKNRETQLLLPVKESRRESSSSELHAKAGGAAVEKEEERRKKDNRSSQKTEGRYSRNSGSHSSSSSAHGGSRSHSSSSSSSKDKRKREGNSHQKKEARRSSHERRKADHERKQKDGSSMPAEEACGAVPKGEASCCEQRSGQETQQREHQKQQPDGSSKEERCKRKKSNDAVQQQELGEHCGKGGDAARSSRTHAKDGKKRTSKTNRKGSPKERDSATSRPLVVQEEQTTQQQQQQHPHLENLVQQQSLGGASDARGDVAAEALKGMEEGEGKKKKQCQTAVGARAGDTFALAAEQPLPSCSAFQRKSRSGSRSHNRNRSGAGSSCVAAAVMREESRGPSLHSSRSSTSGSSRNSAGSTACCKRVTDISNSLVADSGRLSVRGVKREGSSRSSRQGSSHSRRHNSCSRRQSVCSTQQRRSSGRPSVRRSISQPKMRINGEQERSKTSAKKQKTSGGSSKGRDSGHPETKSNTRKKMEEEQQHEERHTRTGLVSEVTGAAGSGQDQFPSLSSSAAAAAAGAASLAAAANAAAAATAALRSSKHKMARKGSLAERSSISRSSSESSSGSRFRKRRQYRRRSSVRRHRSSRSRSSTRSWDSRSASSSRSSGRSGSRRGHRQSRRRGRRRRKSITSRAGSSSRSSSGSESRSRSRSRSGSSSSRSRSSSGSDRSRSRASTSRSRGSGRSSRSGSSRSTSRTHSRSRSRSSSSRSSSSRSSSRSSRSRSESGKSRSRSSTGSNESSRRRRRRRRRSRSRSSSGNSFAILNTSDPTCNSQGDPFPPDLQGPCYIKILPRARDPPVVLGIDNRGLIRLAKQHGCKMKLSAVDDVFPNTDRRLLLVYGGVTTSCVRALQDWVVKTAMKKQQQTQDKLYPQRSPGSGNSGGQKEIQLQGKPGPQQQQQLRRDRSQKRGGQQQQQKSRQQQRGPQAQENDPDLETEITFVIAQSAVRHMRISPWSSLDLTTTTTPPATGEAAATGAGTGGATAAGLTSLGTASAGGAAATAATCQDTSAIALSAAERPGDGGTSEENQQDASSEDAPQQTPGVRQQQQDGREQGPSKKEEEKQSLEQQSLEQPQLTALQQRVKQELPVHQQREEQQPQLEQQRLSPDQQNLEATSTVTKQQQQPNEACSSGSTPYQNGTIETAGALLLRASTPNVEVPSAAAGSTSGQADASAAGPSSAPGCVVHQDETLTDRQQEAVNQQGPSAEQQQETSSTEQQPSVGLFPEQQKSLLSPETTVVPPPPLPAALPAGSSVEQQEQTELSPEQVQQQKQQLERERMLRQRSVWPAGSLLRDLHAIEGAQVKLSRRQEMRWGCRERLVTLRGAVEHVQHALACVSFALQYFLQQRDYMNVKYVRYTEERRRRRRSPSPLPTVPRIVLQEPALPSALVPGLQFQRVLQGLNVQDELVRMTNLRGIIDHHTVEMRGPAYVKVVISDLVTTLLLGTVKSDTENKSCPLRVIEKTCCVQAKVMDPEMPGILERVLVISGQPNSVDKATMAVLEKVYAACIMAGQASQVTWRMCASNSAASLIIGTGGHRVKQLRHITNTRIQINTRDNVPVVDRWERVVTITGTYAAVAAAARAMLPFMHADPNHGQHVHQCYGTGTRLEMPEWAEHAVQREGMDEEAGRRPPLPDDRDVSFRGPCFLKLLIDNALANALIGKDSQTIINLSEATQCVMKFAPPATVFPGCPGERVLGLSGSAEAINNATIAIIEKCKEVHPNLSYDQMYGKMIVPHTCCSSIIGSGGARIREIREATLTRIAVSKKGLNTPERLVCIFGMPQGVHTALVTIFGIIQCDPGVRVMLDIVYPPDVEGDSKKKEADRLSVGLIGAVLEGVQAVVNKVGVDETAEAALKKLQEMQRAAAIAAGELPPDAEEGEFRGPLGPMGQTRGAVQHSNYSTPISFIPASSHLASTAASEASLAAAVQENGAAVAGGLRALGGPHLAVADASPHQLQALTFGVPGAAGDAAAAAEMEFSAPWAIGPETGCGDSGHLLQLQGAEGHAPLGISRTASIYAGGVGRHLLHEGVIAPAGEGPAAGGALPVGDHVAGANTVQQGSWGGPEHIVKQQQHLSRQEKRQRLLEASLNRGLGAAAAREERQLTAAGEHITCGGEDDQHDEDEDLSLAGLMDEKF